MAWWWLLGLERAVLGQGWAQVLIPRDPDRVVAQQILTELTHTRKEKVHNNEFTPPDARNRLFQLVLSTGLKAGCRKAQPRSRPWPLVQPQ